MCYDHEGNWIECYSPEFCTAEPPTHAERIAEAIKHDWDEGEEKIAQELKAMDDTSGVGYPD